MKYLLNLLLIGLIVLLAYMLYSSIQEPISFAAAKNERKDAVVTKLEKIRKGQEVYRLIKGEFAGSFDDLTNVLTNDSIPTIKLVEDPEDPTNPDKFQKIITYTAAKDSIGGLGLTDVANLRYIPFTDKKEFDIKSDTMTYQKTLVSVVEVGTKWSTFMGKFANPKYAKYDASYEPQARIKFGDLNKPSLSGSWSR